MTAPRPAPTPAPDESPTPPGSRREEYELLQDAVDDLIETNGDAGYAAAHRLRRVDALRQRWESYSGASWTAERGGMGARDLRAQVAAALRIAERTAENLLDRAMVLVHELPTTLASLTEGRILELHARALVEHTAALTLAEKRLIEARLLPFAEVITPGKFERLVLKVREELHPETFAERHQDALQDRSVVAVPGANGMGDLHVHAANEHVLAVLNYLDGIARSLGAAPDENRTQAQLRADAFVDQFLDGRALTAAVEKDGTLQEGGLAEVERPRGIVPTVHVTVPALTLAGVDETPGTLDGTVPIDAATARRLVGAASGFSRILTNPETGAIVSFSHDRYRVPAELKRLLQERDATCRFVGCNRQARLCDVDHTKAWEHAGSTELTNLTHLCRGHHRLKHTSSWTVSHDPDGTGTLRWRSPTGHEHPSLPATPLQPPRSHSPGHTIVQSEWSEDPPPF